MLNKKMSFIATVLCLVSFNAPSFAQSGMSGQSTTTSGVSGTTASDPSMNTNSGATTTDTSAMRNTDTSGSANMNSGTSAGMSGTTTDNTTNNAANTTTGTMGTTTDTSAARSADNTTTTTDNRYVQNEEATGRSPFFYILLALIAAALIGYAVKASRRNNVHHTPRQL